MLCHQFGVEFDGLPEADLNLKRLASRNKALAGIDIESLHIGDFDLV